MAKNRTEPFEQVADLYDQIHGTNQMMDDKQILDTVAKSTGQARHMVEKRFRFATGVDWPIIDYVERGVIGLTRAQLVGELDMPMDEKTKLMDESLEKNITDAEFKDYLEKYLEKREASSKE